MERVRLEALLAEGHSLAQIAELAECHPSTVYNWMKRYGLPAPHRERYTPKGGIREAELAALVEVGASVKKMSGDLGVSVSTVCYWLRAYGLHTARSTRTRQNRSARERGLAEIPSQCAKHGSARFRLETSGQYRCVKCNSEAVSRRRRRVKETLVQEAGGHCGVCGYDRYQGALEFHHRERGEKSYALGHDGGTRSLARLREEARKCILLCANCHAEVEAGLVALPCPQPLAPAG
jgi:transposase